MKVPFLDLKAHHDPIRQEIMDAINAVIDASAFAGGSYVTAFEKDFAAYCGTKHAIGVASGTEALWFPLLGLGVGPGDEVVTVPMTFMATAEAISWCGAKPVFVDICEKTYTMNPALLEKAITPRTKAIIPVQLFGQTADMDGVFEVARKHGLPVIEDACQAHGAEYKGKKAGTLGIAGAFSFYPGKNLGAFGEAGAIVTNDDELKRKCDVLREHGQAKKYYHEAIGWNGRMDGIQGAILKVKLKYLNKATQGRQTHGAHYLKLLAGVPNLTLPITAEHRTHVYHIFPVRVRQRDRILKTMGERGVSCGIHYPVPVHLQDAYKHLGHKVGDFPISERCANEFLSLPMYPELNPSMVEAVASTLIQVLKECGE